MQSTPSRVADPRHILWLCLLLLLMFSWLDSLKALVFERADAQSESPQQQKPNILLIVADDLGYNDTDIINPGGLATPNLKALAERGVTFSRHYADATCTPSRVGLLTGRDPERSGFRPVGSEIPAEYATLAEQLHDAGYATYLTGKWHAGEERTSGWPQNKGFDAWFGFLNQWETAGPVTEESKGARKPTYHDPMLRTDGGALAAHPGHLTDLLTEHSLARLEALEQTGQPWFLYHAFLAPHHPIQPESRYAARFPDTPEGRYAALVTQLDDAVGRLLDAVDRDNTLVVFISDNGGTNVERDNNYPFYGKKSETYEGSYRTPLVVSWPAAAPSGRQIDDVVMNVDLYPTILAAAGLPVPPGLDGINLWPTVTGAAPLPPRGRSWEVYGPNINALSLSYLAQGGQWRLSALQGFPPGLYDLAQQPAGATDIGADQPGQRRMLLEAFWREQQRKSEIAVTATAGDTPGQTLYTGFDTLRSPFRFSFAIGLSLGPLTGEAAASGSALELAGQQGLWDLHYLPNRGLQLRLGDAVLTDAGFDPARCNPVVVTGYLQPRAHLATRDPLSQLKLYNGGLLRDRKRGFDFSHIDPDTLHRPTYVNAGGDALFSNIMLHSFSDDFTPRLAPERVELYENLYRERQIPMPEVHRWDDRLCQE